MNYDFRDHYSVGQSVRIDTELDQSDDTFIVAKVTKVTTFCVHCRATDSTLYRIARNVDGQPWIADTCEDCTLTVID
jgi:hypothetical protein